MPFTSTTKYEPINLKKEVYSLKDRIVDDLDLKNNVYDYLTIRSREILLEAIEKAKEITVKKYMVKAKPTPKPKKQIKLLSDSDEESEIPTESEPEEVILKKIKRKAKMLKKIDEQLQAPVPPVRRGLGLWRD